MKDFFKGAATAVMVVFGGIGAGYLLGSLMVWAAEARHPHYEIRQEYRPAISRHMYWVYRKGTLIAGRSSQKEAEDLINKRAGEEITVKTYP